MEIDTIFVKIETIFDTFDTYLQRHIIEYLPRELCISTERYNQCYVYKLRKPRDEFNVKKRIACHVKYIFKKRYILPERLYKHTYYSLKETCNKMRKEGWGINYNGNGVEIDYCHNLDTARINTLRNIKYLNINFVCSGNGQNNIFPEICYLINLETLNVCGAPHDVLHNKITYISPNIKYLTKLKRLRFEYISIETLPPEIGCLVNLQCIVIYSSLLTELPSEIGRLKKLTSIYIKCAKLKHIPPEMGRLENLTRIDLLHNKIEEIPHTFGGLKNLQTLVLSSNKIQYVPSCVFNLERILYICLSRNQITRVECNNKTRCNVHVINLKCNNISEFPTQLCKSINLYKLKLGGNSVSEIPEELQDYPIEIKI